MHQQAYMNIRITLFTDKSSALENFIVYIRTRGVFKN